MKAFHKYLTHGGGQEGLTVGGTPGLMACVSLCLSISGLLRTVPPFSRPLLLSVATEILVKKGKEDDETIHSFISRRLGKEVWTRSQTFLSEFRLCEISMMCESKSCLNGSFAL